MHDWPGDEYVLKSGSDARISEERLGASKVWAKG